MNSQTCHPIDGYVDAIPAPSTGPDTAAFELIHSPAHAGQIAPDAADTVYACDTDDPHIADVLLREIRLGDLIRVTGAVVQPGIHNTPTRIRVNGLEVLAAAPHTRELRGGDGDIDAARPPVHGPRTVASVHDLRPTVFE